MSEESKKSKGFLSMAKDWEIFKKLKQVKHIGLIITIIFIIVLLVILFGNFSLSSSGSQISNGMAYTSSTSYVNEMEDKLRTLLGKVKGAGSVEVMLTVESGTSLVLATEDEIKTTGSGESAEITTSKSPIILKQDGENQPVIVSEVLPKIIGVVVVSSGAENISVRLSLLNAVQTLLNLGTDEIQILVGE